MNDRRNLLELVKGLPSFATEYDKLLLRQALALAEIDAEFRQRITENPEETLRELGIRLPNGNRIVVLRPGDHTISLTKSTGAIATTLEASGKTDSDSRTDAGKLFFQLEVSHYSSNLLPIGHRGDDELHIKLPPAVEVVDVMFDKWVGGSDATLIKTSRDERVFRADIHWWFNGWMKCKYSLKVSVNDPKGLADYTSYLYELNTMLASPHVDNVPDPNNWTHIFQSVWDYPYS